jgi:hypothetical protein
MILTNLLRKCFLYDFQIHITHVCDDEYGFQAEVIREVVKRKPGGKVKADFALFPSREMTKVKFMQSLILVSLIG